MEYLEVTSDLEGGDPVTFTARDLTADDVPAEEEPGAVLFALLNKLIGA